MLTTQGLSKRFGAVTVLNGIDFELQPGEVHALFGANGAGKSTLSKLIAGHLQPNAGQITLNGHSCSFRSPREALEAGIAMVMQETSLAPDLPVFENVFLPLYGGKERCRFAELRRKTSAILEQLGVAEEIDPQDRTGDLSAAHRQLIEIARALALNARVIIFDEPTTSLSPSETAKLFAIMGRLRTEGCAMIFVSHRLEELFTITDRVTVLRDGGVAAHGARTSDLTQAELIRLMIGRDVESVPRNPEHGVTRKDEPVLAVQHLRAGPLVRDVSFTLHKGEILGLGGLVGAGRSETLEAIFGLRAIQGGAFLFHGKSFRAKRPLDAIRAGLGYLAEDRRAQSILPDLSVRENLLVAALSAQRSSWVRYESFRERAAQLAIKLDLPPHRLDDESMFSFSGGMQQKVLLMRWLLLEPDVLLLDEPTKGIDIGARTAIYTLLRAVAAEGVSVLVVSSDFQELIDLCDRIVPISDGCSIGAVPAALLDEEKLLMLAAPRSSMATQRSWIDRMAATHGAAVFWAIVDSESLICLAASPGADASLGFASGAVSLIAQTRVPKALAHAVERGTVVEANGTTTCLLGVRNTRGHDLGVIGLAFGAGVSPSQLTRLRDEIAQDIAGQERERILLTL